MIDNELIGSPHLQPTGRYGFTKPVLCFLTVVILLSRALTIAAQSQDLKRKIQEVMADLKPYIWIRQNEIVQLGPAALPYLVAYTSHERPDVRAFVLMLIGRISSRDRHVLIGDQRVVNILSLALTDSDSTVVKQAAIELESVDKRVVDDVQISRLLSAVKDKGLYHALLRLGELGTRSTVEELRAYTKSPDPAVARGSRVALSRLGEQQYVQELVVDLSSSDEQIRVQAFKKLAYVKDRSTVPAIASFLFVDGPSFPPTHHGGRFAWKLLAAETLGEILETPPLRKRGEELTPDDMQVWRKWWLANKEKHNWALEH